MAFPAIAHFGPAPKCLLASLVVLAAFATPGSAVASDRQVSHHPAVATLTVSPTSVAHAGGSVHLKANVHHAASCRTKSSPSLAGLPKTKSCSSGHLALTLHVPADPGSASRHFTITVTATKGSHHSSKTVTLTQAARPAAPTVSDFTVTPKQLTASGGVVHLTATVKHATTCAVSASPAVTGLPVTVPCTSASFSHSVTLPADTGTASKSYLFSLTAKGAGGHITAASHPMANVAGVSAATPITSVSAASAALPSGATTGADENATLASVSCPSAGHCVAVGYYYSPVVAPEITNESGLIETLDGSTWKASAAPLPTDVDPDESAVALDSVSCSSATNCAAVGYYVASNEGEEPYVATLSGTTWTWQAASVPADGPYRIGGNLLSVSCAPDGSCFAVGKSAPPGDDADALIEEPSAGGWSGVEAPLPSNADPEESNGTEIEDVLYDVSCTSATSCSAVGGYTTGSDETLSTEGMADTLSVSGWTSTQLAPTADEGYDKVVSCGGDICAATGDYDTDYPEIQTEESGEWDPTDAVAAPQPTAFNGAGLSAAACTSDSSCVLVGEADSPSADAYGLIDTGSGTSYSDLAAPVPDNARSTGATSNLVAVSCPAPGSCMAVGDYNGTDASADYEDGLLDTETTSNGTSTWNPTEVPIPSGSDNPGTLSAVSCVASWGCVAVGVVSPAGTNAVPETAMAPLPSGG